MILDSLRDLRLIYTMNFKAMPVAPRIGAMGRSLRKKLFPRTPPTVMLLSVSSRCQCNCRHCGVKHRPQPDAGDTTKRDLSADEAVSVLRQFRELGGVKVYFFGGEPLLRKDLADLVRKATDLGLSSTLSTNGVLLDEGKARALKEAGICAIEVSMDSADPETFAEYRGYPGIMEKVQSAIRFARDEGIPTSIATYAYRENLDGGLAEIIRLGREMGVRSIRILEPIAAGEWSHQIDQKITGEERTKLLSFREPGFVHSENQGGRFGNCSAIRGDLLYVASDGSVTPCCYMNVGLGNVRDTPLREIIGALGDLRDYDGRSDGCPVNDAEFRSRFHLDA